MHDLLQVIKKLLGKNLTKKIRPLGHGLKSFLAAAYYGFPVRKLKLIGVNATKGKTSTVILAGRLMNLAGLRTGYISTAVINTMGAVSDEFTNPFKMTTIDGVWLNRYLRDMVRSGCEYAVLEMSSQGLEQNRHWGLGSFGVGVFMNLYPEHIEAHGSIENYLRQKSKLFENITDNGYFIFTSNSEQKKNVETIFSNIKPKKLETLNLLPLSDSDFEVKTEQESIYRILAYQGKNYFTGFTTDFEIQNLVYAIKVLEIFKPKTLNNLQQYLSILNPTIPGRMEYVIRDNRVVDQNKPTFLDFPANSSISVIVDYAHEPKSLEKLLENLVFFKTVGYYTDIIHVLSSDGVGRDDWKKPIMGEISFQHANCTIVTTDNYDAKDNPSDIVNLLAKSIPADKIFEREILLESLADKKVIKEIDRRKAFQKSIELASYFLDNKDRADSLQNMKRKVVIVSTGVGSEYGLTQPQGVMEWDEKAVWQEEFLKKFSNKRP